MMKRVLIVGASSGIGKALAILYAQKGFKVGITGRRKSLLEQMVEQYPENLISQSWDISVDNNTEELKTITEKLGGLDVLILNAGISALNKTLDFDIDKKAIAVNVLGFTEIIDWTYNYFKQRSGGQIAAVTSAAGRRGYSDAPAYHASKAYQMNYLESLRNKAIKEKSNIYVTDIRPGFIDTAMTNDKYRFLVSSAEQAAKIIYNSIVEQRNITYVPFRWKMITNVWKLVPVWAY